MSIASRLEQIRALHAASLVSAGVPTGAPAGLKRLVAEHAQLRRASGWTWKAIAEELPVSTTTVRAWIGDSKSEMGGLVPVTVTAEPVSSVEVEGLLLTSPAGFRLSGLSLDQAARLLGRLG